MKRYTFALNDNFRNNNTTITNKTDWSSILDDIISNNIKKNNPYLNAYTYATCYNCPLSNSICNTSGILKDDDYIKAALFLSKFNKRNDFKKINCERGKIYHIGSTPIIYYDDEIQIGFDIIPYRALKNRDYILGLTDDTKNAIINIYNIYINL